MQNLKKKNLVKKLKLNQENIYTQFFYLQQNGAIDVITSPMSNQIIVYYGIFWHQLLITWRRVTRCSYLIVNYIASH